MQYRTDHYLDRIVAFHGVAMIGWTKDVPVRFGPPGRMTALEIEAMIPLWKTGQIQFVRVKCGHVALMRQEYCQLMDEGKLARPRPPKTRKDKGQRHPRTNPLTVGKRSHGPVKSVEEITPEYEAWVAGSGEV